MNTHPAQENGRSSWPLVQLEYAVPYHTMPCIPYLYFKSHFVQFSSVQTIPYHTPATGAPYHTFTDLSSPYQYHTIPCQFSMVGGYWATGLFLRTSRRGAWELIRKPESPPGSQQRCTFSHTRSCCLVAAVKFRCCARRGLVLHQPRLHWR